MHFFYSVKNHPKIPIFSTFIKNEFCETLKEKITAWYIELLYLSITPTVVVQHKKSSLGN